MNEKLQQTIEMLFKKYSNGTSLSEGDYDYLMDKQDFIVAINEFLKEEKLFTEQDMKDCWEQAQESKEDQMNYYIGEQKKRTQPDFEEWFENFKNKK